MKTKRFKGSFTDQSFGFLSGNRMAITDCTNIVKVVDLKTQRIIARVKMAKEQIFCLATSRNGRLIVSGHDGGTVTIYDCKTSQRSACQKVNGLRNADVRSVAISPNNRFIAGVIFSSSDVVGLDLLVVWEAKTGKIKLTKSWWRWSHITKKSKKKERYGEHIESVAFAPDSRSIVVTRGIMPYRVTVVNF